MSSAVGKKLGKYRIDALLGEGAMGEVYRGEHEELGRPVAIKTLKPQVSADPQLVNRFFAEARAVNIIRHENIVECTDLVRGSGGQDSYIVMELLEGKTLAQAIRAAGRMAPRRAVRIASQIADAIGAAHTAGIVHRDLKPDNVFLIARAGTEDYVKILDFGIARLRPDMGQIHATQTGALIGTPAYMSPEQCRGEKVGPASDMYALGCILWEMVTGTMLFNRPSLAMVLAAHLSEEPERADAVEPTVPTALADVIAQTLRKNPDERFGTMAAMRVALLGAVGYDVSATESMLAADPALLNAVRPTAPRPRVAGDVGMLDTMPPDAAALAATVPPTQVHAAGRSSIDVAVEKQTIEQPPARRGAMFAAVGGAVAVLGVIAAIAIPGSGSRKSAGTPPPPDAAAVAPAPADAAPVRVAQPPPPDAAPPVEDLEVTQTSGDTTEKRKPRRKRKAADDATTATTPPPPPPDDGKGMAKDSDKDADDKPDLTKKLVD